MTKKIIIITITILICLLLATLWLGKSNKPANILPSPVITAPIETPLPTIRPGGGYQTPEFLEKEKAFIKRTPLLQRLPYDATYFEVEYIDEQRLIIYSKTDDKQRDFESARSWFVENGIDLSQITVEYK